MDRDKMSNLYKGPSIDASYQVSVHLAEGFQRRRLKCEKLTDDGRQVMAKAHFAFGKVSYNFPVGKSETKISKYCKLITYLYKNDTSQQMWSYKSTVKFYLQFT
jgi:hypothetical protein